MASLYSTVALSLARLVIVKYKDDSGLQNSKFSEKTASVLTIIWFLALAISIPPLLGFGKYGQNMVAVRYISFCNHPLENIIIDIAMKINRIYSTHFIAVYHLGQMMSLCQKPIYGIYVSLVLLFLQ